MQLGGSRNTGIGVDDPLEEQRLQTEHASKMQKVSTFQLGESATLTGANDPPHALNLWYIDDCGNPPEDRSHLLHRRPGRGPACKEN